MRNSTVRAGRGITMIAALIVCQLAAVRTARAQGRQEANAAMPAPAAIVAPLEPVLGTPALAVIVDSTSVLAVRDTLVGPMTQSGVFPDSHAWPARSRIAVPAQRPRVMVPLYVSMAALQGLDIVSTRQALGAGGREANPLVAPLAGSPAAMVAVKAGLTGALIYASERLWKQNRKAAILTLVAANLGYAAVVSHNFALAAGAPGTR